jgi:RNA polymerase sigma factor (sigma-70 family)
MPPPPPAEGLASRIFLGPALRTQPDRRLVSLVRQGYELAFEEIVRRYDKALGRYAAAIVPRHRAEDVTQDAFSKALLALRDTEAEIELRPWLYRIVRNTALNDLRDQPAVEALDETLPHLHTAHEEAVRREELRDLMSRLRALPEPQRAAIVMRELEGLSHEEIAAALGLSGGGARQTIYRARRVPFLKALLAGGAVADAGAAGAGVAGAGGAALAGGSAGGGAAMALKAAAATVLVAGTVGTGVALQERGDAGPAGAAAAESSGEAPRSAGSGAGAGGAPLAAGDNRGPGGGGSSGGDDRSPSSGPGGGENRGGSSGPGSDDGTGSATLGGEDHSGSGSSGSGISGGDDSGHSGSGSPSSGPGSGGSGDTSGESSHSGPGGGGGEPTTTTTSPTAPQPIEMESSNSGSGSSGSGSGSSGGGDDLPDLPD